MARAANARYDVNGRTVFITGAARGIGKASAERLYAKGANVALVGLEPERLEEIAAAKETKAEKKAFEGWLKEMEVQDGLHTPSVEEYRERLAAEETVK